MGSQMSRSVMREQISALQVEVKAQEERAKHWMKRAQDHANEERNWRMLLAAIVARVPGGMTTVSQAELAAVVGNKQTIERVVDPGGAEVLVRVYDAESEAPPAPPHEPGRNPVEPEDEDHAPEPTS